MESALSDDELMAKVNEGDKEAFAALYRRHNSCIFGFCMRFFSGNRAKAEDTAQEVWTRVATYSESYQPGNRFKYWALTIARNTALREFDKHKIRADSLGEEEASVPSDFDLEDTLIEKARAETVKNAVDALPDAQRAAVVLWITHEKSYDEIAGALGLSMPATKSLLHRAKQSLIKALRGADE